MRAVALAFALSACASVQPPAAPSPPSGACTAAPLAELPDFVGRMWSESLHAEAQRLSRARAVRVIHPGDMVTMDYREDRLNVHLTDGGRVERFNCG